MSRRAELRRAARDAGRADIPMVPGVVPDGTVETLERALAEAHEDLPQIPGTRVEVVTFEPAVGLAIVEDAFGAETALEIARRLDECGPDALVALAGRFPPGYHAARPTEPGGR